MVNEQDKPDNREQNAHTGHTRVGTARLAHFVRFHDLHGDQFWSAVRTFGQPDFLHRHWDRRALREIADGDLVLFAKGEADQPHVPFNGDDEAYALPAAEVRP